MASADIHEEGNDLETLLAKATNPLHRTPDAEALTAFCLVVEKEKDGPATALRLLAHKIQSPIEKESLMALLVLEESVKKCGPKYRSEVGKFRFLNEMIKVVSPKYLGTRASSKVKQKIVEMMFLWSMELKAETKIFEAYQMLKRQGVVIEDPVYILEYYEPPPPPAPRPKNDSIFEDEEKAQQLQKLLRSRNAEDLQAANRLIKNMVKEADKKMELVAKRSTELETVHNNASVLADMLNHFKPGETSEEEKDLMKELFESCERLRPKLFRLAGELDEKDEGLGDILKANDELTVVINSYKRTVGLENGSDRDTKNMTPPSKVEASLLDLGSPEQQQPSPIRHTADSSLLDDQLLALGLCDSTDKENISKESSQSKSSEKITSSVSSNLSDLDHIFSSSNHSNISSLQMTFPLQNTSLSSSSNPVINSNYSSDIFLGGDTSDVALLKPTHSSIVASSSSSNQSTAAPVSKGLEELDELGQTLLKKSLPSSAVKLEFPSTPQKVPLSQMKQQSQVQSQTALTNSATATMSLDSKTSTVGKISPVRSPAHEILSLNDVFVPLETVQPGQLPPLSLHEKNDLAVVIHFGKDSPRPDITVMVVSTMSKSSSPVKNVSFQAAVPKSMKIKLQPPSATDLPPHNPILPPAAITQVMLLANPQKENVRFKYKVNYKINDEDFTDIGEIDSLLASR